MPKPTRNKATERPAYLQEKIEIYLKPFKFEMSECPCSLCQGQDNKISQEITTTNGES